MAAELFLEEIVIMSSPGTKMLDGSAQKILIWPQDKIIKLLEIQY